MNDREQLAEASEILRDLLQCFRQRDALIRHKTQDGKWVEIGEDLVDVVNRARDMVGVE